MGGGEASLAVGQRPYTVAFVIDGNGDSLPDDREAVPFLGGFDQWWGRLCSLTASVAR